MPGFGPAAEVLFFREKDPTTVALFETQHAQTPRLVTSEWADASHGRAGQLAEPVLRLVEGLKQGPPRNESVRPGDRVEGDEQCEGESPQGISCGMTASSAGMIKDKTPLANIWNNYN